MDTVGLRRAIMGAAEVLVAADAVADTAAAEIRTLGKVAEEVTVRQDVTTMTTGATTTIEDEAGTMTNDGELQ